MDQRPAPKHPLRVILEKLYQIEDAQYAELHAQQARKSFQRLGKDEFPYVEDAFAELDLPGEVQHYLERWIFRFAPRSISPADLVKAIIRLIDLLHPPHFFEKDEDGSDYIDRLAYEAVVEEALRDFLGDEDDLDVETPKQSLSGKQRQAWLDLAQVEPVITKIKTQANLEHFVIGLLKIFKTKKFLDQMLTDLPEIHKLLK